MEETPQPTEPLAGEIHDLLTESDNETTHFCFEEEMIEEVMQQFYNEIAGSLVYQPPPTQLPPPSSSPLLMDDGKNGSCGASVSDSASTVMAGIEAASSGGRLPVGKAEVEKGSSAVESGSDELDDEWLGRVLSWEQSQPVERRQRF